MGDPDGALLGSALVDQRFAKGLKKTLKRPPATYGANFKDFLGTLMINETDFNAQAMKDNTWCSLSHGNEQLSDLPSGYVYFTIADIAYEKRLETKFQQAPIPNQWQPSKWVTTTKVNYWLTPRRDPKVDTLLLWSNRGTVKEVGSFRGLVAGADCYYWAYSERQLDKAVLKDYGYKPFKGDRGRATRKNKLRVGGRTIFFANGPIVKVKFQLLRSSHVAKVGTLKTTESEHGTILSTHRVRDANEYHPVSGMSLPGLENDGTLAKSVDQATHHDFQDTSGGGFPPDVMKDWVDPRDPATDANTGVGDGSARNDPGTEDQHHHSTGHQNDDDDADDEDDDARPEDDGLQTLGDGYDSDQQDVRLAATFPYTGSRS
ncbi:hypothetical protein DOTSEDRAFT_24452 [Dothistroma septosporum NZE10]|uniref:Uncharacterized protein n=1 Tax=Dothistroma septosporum (strain NZE10 / CBS 128990) TaxID=675120 RepID=N1PM27_DOTSN|nr:hypothetical protein DOTSEDRAFT_24452 [Dothistroma septosporum NZE10]